MLAPLNFLFCSRIRQATTELIAVAPDAIVSTTSTTTRALKDATGKIPIVAAVRRFYCAWFYEKPISSDRKYNRLHDLQQHAGC
jgi:hypothetical protein